MADKKLNEVTKVTDMAYVPVIMSDGSIGQIAKADLASVVAGVFPTLNENTLVQSGLLYGQIMIEGDVNDVVGRAIVQIRPHDTGSNIKNLPVKEYGVLVNFTNELEINPNNSYYRSQTFYTSSKVYYRVFSSQWTSWMRIDNFGYNSLEDMANALKPLLGLS